MSYFLELVRYKIVLIGVVMVLLAIPGYLMVPPLMTREMNKFSGGNAASSLNNQIFSQLGMPPIDSMITATKYTFAGLIFGGIAMIGFGAITKKMKKAPPIKVHLEPDQTLEKKEDSSLKALHLLQERLAKGEITSSQFQNLKKMVEDKI